MGSWYATPSVLLIYNIFFVMTRWMWYISEVLLCKGHDIQLAINSDEYLYNINGEISGFPWWKCDIGIFF